MDENKSLIKKDSAFVQKVGNQIAITNKLLAISDEQKFVDFFVSHPEFFIDLISKYYSFDECMIEKYEDYLNFHNLSDNNNLHWTLRLIEKYENKWSWFWENEEDSFYSNDYRKGGLSLNKKLPWTIEFVNRYRDKWRWEYLAFFSCTSIVVEDILEFEKEFEYDENHYLDKRHKFWYMLTNNPNILWSVESIEKYEDGPEEWGDPGKIWDHLSESKNLPWTIQLIEKYKSYWIWWSLSGNTALPWTTELIEKYKHEWHWHTLTRNRNLPWSVELIEKYKDEWHWGDLSRNENLPWSVELIEKYKDEWSWYGLSGNKNLPWSVELIEKYYEYWDWDTLSRNYNLPWSSDFIVKHDEKWDWKSLSGNKALSCSMELIEKYKEKWDWEVLSGNKDLFWSIELLKKHEKRLFHGNFFNSEIFKNPNLPWSLELIKIHVNIFNSYYSYPEDYWVSWEKVFKNKVNDKMIERVFNELEKKRK